VKYELNLSGNSGKLKTTLIGDYLHHKDLLELDEERQACQQAIAKLKAKQSQAIASTSKESPKKSGSWFGGSSKKDDSVAVVAASDKSANTS